MSVPTQPRNLELSIDALALLDMSVCANLTHEEDLLAVAEATRMPAEEILQIRTRIGTLANLLTVLRAAASVSVAFAEEKTL